MREQHQFVVVIHYGDDVVSTFGPFKDNDEAITFTSVKEQELKVFAPDAFMQVLRLNDPSIKLTEGL